MADGLNRKLENSVKRIVRQFLAVLAARHHRKWHSIGENGDIKKIIIIRQHNQFGDVLCTTPLLRALNRKFDLKELAVVVSPQNIEAIRGCKYVTKIINYDKLSFYRKPSLFISFCRQLRKGYDVLLVPSNVSMSLTNDVMAFFAKAKTKIGPRSLEGKSNKTSSVYDLAMDLNWDGSITHQTFRNMKVASPLEIIPRKDDGELEYEVDENILCEVDNFVATVGSGKSPRIAVHAGAGKVTNRWSVVNFVMLSELLHNVLNAEIYFTEGSFDHEIMEHLTNFINVPFVRVRNKTIPFVAALLKKMDLVITNDTGIMHLAAAVGTLTLSLFGPTDPLQWAPLNGDRKQGKGNREHKFILGKNGDINSIDVDKVFNTVKKMLKTN